MALQQIEFPVRGMDCAGCCSSVQKALTALPGVQHADVLLAQTGTAFTRSVLLFTGIIAGLVLLIVVAGEWLGLFDTITDRIPWYIGWLIVFLGWYPILHNVIRATLRREVISHTLMSIGVIAALAIGEWTTAAIVVLFMRVGDYVESFTAERARRAVKDLTKLAPQTARVERNGVEQEVWMGW
jgi:Cd2+/Zn2+-exporting ATPase/Cu+-exporting ATPase